MITSCQSYILLTFYPFPTFNCNFVYKEFPSSSSYHLMEVSRISIPFVKPLHLGFFCIQLIKVGSLRINRVKDVFFFSFVDLFLVQLDLLEDITKFLLGPCIKGTKHPFQFLVKFPHSIAFHLLFRASFQSFHVKRIVNLEINEYEVPNVIIFF